VTTPSQPSGGNVFTRKLGPLPMWAWMGIALAIALLYYLYKKNTAAASSTNTSAAQTAATNNTPGGVDSSLVPQFVNQTYTNVTPPAAPAATPAAATTPTITSGAIPNVVGESAAAATTHLQADGFKVSSGGLAGNVIVTGTSPATPTHEAHGTVVTLQGNPKKVIPKTESS